MHFNRLDEISDIIDSLHKTPKYSNNGISMVRCTDVKYGYLKLDNTLKVDSNVYEDFSRRYKPNINNIVITRVGSYGITALVKNSNFCLGQNTSAIIPKINPRYLYHALNSKYVKNQIEFSVVGSTQKTLSLKSISSLEIPRFGEQAEKEIASILSSLDEKIELNNKMNQTLEKMAQTLFKEWFEEFNFPNAEGKPYKTNKGAMHPSELGEIPKEWDVDDLINKSEIISKGTTPRTKDVKDLIPSIQFLKVKDIDTNGVIKLHSLEKIPKEVHEKQLKRSILKVDDILFSIAGTIGRVSIVPNNLDNSNCNQAIAFIRLKDKKKLKQFVYQWIKTYKIQNEINSSIVQGVQANVSLTTLGKLQIIVPTDKIMSKFNDLIIPISEQIKQNQQQTQTLTKLRDTLLPKLMSGEIKV